MSVSYTYQQLQNQIALELGYRTDLLNIPAGFTVALSPIAQAIQNAIAKHERERFYFNELTSINAFNTVTEQEFYTSAAFGGLGTMPHIDKLWILISGNRYTLNPRTEQYLSDTSVNPSVSGQPVDYALYGETLRLYPIPSGAYPITPEGTQRLAALVQPTDENAWTQDAGDLIKAEAKFDLYTHFLKNPAGALAMKNAIYGDPNDPTEIGLLDALQSETYQRTAVGKTRPSYF